MTLHLLHQHYSYTLQNLDSLQPHYHHKHHHYQHHYNHLKIYLANRNLYLNLTNYCHMHQSIHPQILQTCNHHQMIDKNCIHGSSIHYHTLLLLMHNLQRGLLIPPTRLQKQYTNKPDNHQEIHNYYHQELSRLFHQNIHHNHLLLQILRINLYNLLLKNHHIHLHNLNIDIHLNLHNYMQSHHHIQQQQDTQL